MKTTTLCVHHGTYHDHATRGVNSPIFTSSSYQYLNTTDCIYPRHFNTPNQQAVEAKMAALEEAEEAVLFASGMAAISTAILSCVSAGDHVVLLDSLYGGTHHFVTDTFARLGIDYTFVATSPEAIGAAITDKTRMIVIESPTNPLMEIIDIGKVADLARERGILTLIDNTFATPINQRPLTLDIDLVVHSGTKFLGGHSDLACGIVAGRQELTRRIRAMASHLGGSLNAISCYLLERSLKTLALRVEKQSENAMQIADYLEQHPLVEKVHYPGLAKFQGHTTASRQMNSFGAMLSFELAAGQDPEAFQRRLRLITPAISLGGVETLICSPSRTSHAEMSKEERQRVGISDNLLRFSTGIEDVDDLIDDLKQAFG